MKDPELATHELQARLAAIVDSSDDAIIAKDLEGVIQSWNHGAEQIFGYSRDEAVGRHISLLIPDDHISEEDTIITKIRAGERISHYETVRRRKDGRLIDVSLTVSPVKEPGGRVIGASKIARDITEQKAARRALAEMNTMLEQRIQERTAHLQRTLDDLESFNSAVSHDLRTPLRAVTGLIQLILQDGKIDAGARRHLDMALQAAREMSRTIEALLRLSRLESREIRREEVDVTGIATRILTRLHRQQPDRLVDVDVEAGVTAFADPTMAEVVLENLLSNAWKFSAGKPSARIRVAKVPTGSGAYGFLVEDTGVGFSDDEAETLFRPFQRLRPTDFEGVGIGLATVKRILAAHGGTIRAAGRPGEGATLTVDFNGRDGSMTRTDPRGPR